jgi:hypothetical protein
MARTCMAAVGWRCPTVFHLGDRDGVERGCKVSTVGRALEPWLTHYNSSESSWMCTRILPSELLYSSLVHDPYRQSDEVENLENPILTKP